MSGDGRLNRNQKPSHSKVDLGITLLVLFAVAGLAVSFEFSDFDAWTPAELQLLGP
jgi:hypothetical protein